jgi:anti-sigma factor RsiW
MDQFSRLSATQRSNLVAYLDGELDDQDTAEIESVLAHSAVARNDVEQLARTYDLLDELPRLQAPREFTERTLTTVRLDGVRPDYTQTEWYRRLQRGSVLAGWLVAMTAASALGYLITRAWVPNEADVLVRDFEVIQRLDEYREVDNVEFLRTLDAQHGPLLKEIRERGLREEAQ